MNCSNCNIELNNQNWSISRQNRCKYICKICENLSNRKRYKNNKENYLLNYKKSYKNLKKEVFDYYGGRCENCLSDDKDVISLDHIDGNGRKHRKEVLKTDSGTGFYKWVFKNKPNNIRILCYNCNCAHSMKKIELKENNIFNNLCKYCGSSDNLKFRICNICKNILKKNLQIDLKKEAYTRYGGKCFHCLVDNEEYLTIDHIDNLGAAHRKIIGPNIYIWLKRQNYPIDNFQILCYNCNYKKALI